MNSSMYNSSVEVSAAICPSKRCLSAMSSIGSQPRKATTKRPDAAAEIAALRATRWMPCSHAITAPTMTSATTQK
jgi:hypothetical protein